jgi:hypothetical protein
VADVKAVVPVVVRSGPMMAEPEPNPAPAAIESVMDDEFVYTEIMVPAAIPGPDTAQPNIVALNRPAEVNVVNPDAVTAVAMVC